MAMNLHHSLRALTLLGLSAGAVALPAGASAFGTEPLGLTIGLTPTISSDYLFRGISQTRNRPAVQATVDIQHGSGLYVGGFVSNVTFLGANARQEADALAGWRTTVSGISLDFGGIAYTYPGFENRPASAYDLQYVELAAKASFNISDLPLPAKVLASLNYSPNYQLESGTGLYVEGGLELALPHDLTLAGRGGYQWIQNNARWGSPDFANWSVSLSYSISDFVLTAGYFDTSLNRGECFGGQKICETRSMLYLSRTF